MTSGSGPRPKSPSANSKFPVVGVEQKLPDPICSDAIDPLLPVVRAPIGPLFWNVHYTPIGRSARILSSVSLNSLVDSLSEFGLSLTIAAHQRLH